MEGARKLRLRVVGSRTRFLITASVLVLLWLAFVWLAATGRLAELRYLNVPLLHRYPPAGYLQNPFNAGDKGDLISVSEANRVKAALLQDGQIELQALGQGDPTLHANADTGRASESLSALISQNNARGVVEREEIHLDAIVVGHLADPNDPAIVWLVEERGKATISDYANGTNALVRQQAITFVARFWLQKLAARYLIADVSINSQPRPTASP